MVKKDRRGEVKQLISLGKEEGHLPYEEVRSILPREAVSSEQIDELITFSDLDLDLIEPEGCPKGLPIHTTMACRWTILTRAG